MLAVPACTCACWLAAGVCMLAGCRHAQAQCRHAHAGCRQTCTSGSKRHCMLWVQGHAHASCRVMLALLYVSLLPSLLQIKQAQVTAGILTFKFSLMPTSLRYSPLHLCCSLLLPCFAKVAMALACFVKSYMISNLFVLLCTRVT